MLDRVQPLGVRGVSRFLDLPALSFVVPIPGSGTNNIAYAQFATPPSSDFKVSRFSFLVPAIQKPGGSLVNVPFLPGNLGALHGSNESTLQVFFGGQASAILGLPNKLLNSTLGGQLKGRWNTFSNGNGSAWTTSWDQEGDASLYAPRGTSLCEIAFYLPTWLSAYTGSTFSLTASPPQAFAHLLVEVVS